MKSSTRLAFILASLTLLTLNSCIWQKDELAQIGKDYTPSYEDDEFYYYNGGETPGYLHGSISLIYGYSYYHGPRYECPICHGHPCSGHSGRASNWARNDSSGSHRSNGGGGGSITPLYVHKSSGVNGGAAEAHPRDWFTSRGYTPSRLEKTDDHGHSTKRNDHDSDDRRSSLKSHSLPPGFVDRLKSEIPSGSQSPSNLSLGVNGHSTNTSSSSSSKKDDDNNKKR